MSKNGKGTMKKLRACPRNLAEAHHLRFRQWRKLGPWRTRADPPLENGPLAGGVLNAGLANQPGF